MAESPYIRNVTAADFAAVVLDGSRQVPVLVDFWASWCAPCKMLMPVLQKLADDYEGTFLVAKVDTDKERELAMEYGIRSLPTLKLFHNGTVVDEVMGAQPESVLREIIDRHVERESDQAVEAALAAREAGNVEGALQSLRDIAENDPENSRATIELTQILIAEERIEEAEQALRTIPTHLASEPAVGFLQTQIKFARVAQQAPDERTLRETIAADAGNSEARYQLGVLLALQGHFEAALEFLLELVQRDRKFGDDAGRKAMLDVFALMDGQDELVSRFRGRMFAALH
jgi:putative thioredoxin